MKFVKGISLFFIYPLVMFGIGFYAGVECMHFFYPGSNPVRETQELPEENWPEQIADNQTAIVDVAASHETLSVDTEYVLEETDIASHSVVETILTIPQQYVGLNREQFLECMERYEMYPPLSELERGFINLEVLSFARERVVIQMNYQYVQPSNSFYLAVHDNEVVVYLEDKETIYINTGILLEDLPEEVQLEIIQMLWMEDEETLYHFLENYSS